MYSKELKERKNQLKVIIEIIEKELPKLPQGKLRIQKFRDTHQYYIVSEKGETHGEYIKVNNRKLAEELAQRSYYERVLKEAQREYRAISIFLGQMEGKRPEEIYSDMKLCRKELVTPLAVTDKEYARTWETTPYEKNPYNPEECIHPTDKGDLVRSKSEARIADMYFHLGIPYRYEAPVILENGKKKYPDFTLLKLPERRLYYHEHMGVMEDEFYRHNNMIKLKEYSESNIFVGKNLILTFETDYAPLDIKAVRKNIKDIFGI